MQDVPGPSAVFRCRIHLDISEVGPGGGQKVGVASPRQCPSQKLWSFGGMGFAAEEQPPVDYALADRGPLSTLFREIRHIDEPAIAAAAIGFLG